RSVSHLNAPRLLRTSNECIRVEAQMNSIFYGYRKDRPAARPVLVKAVILVGFVIFGASPFAEWVHAQTGGDATSEFKRISEELSAARLSGGNENEARMEKALAYLDSIAVSVLK